MKPGWILAALMAIGLRASAGADVTAYVTVEGPALAHPAKKIAGTMFQMAGVTVAWRKGRPPASGDSGLVVHIELAQRTPPDYLPAALAVSYPFAGCSKSIRVFHDRVRSLARGELGLEARLLAHVLVHEITHVIQ
jgi:hypothetical protein